MVYGGGGNRTRVRKDPHSDVYECSLQFKISNFRTPIGRISNFLFLFVSPLLRRKLTLGSLYFLCPVPTDRHGRSGHWLTKQPKRIRNYCCLFFSARLARARNSIRNQSTNNSPSKPVHPQMYSGELIITSI